MADASAFLRQIVDVRIVDREHQVHEEPRQGDGAGGRRSLSRGVSQLEGLLDAEVGQPFDLDDPAVVLKRELLRIPFYGWMAWKAGMISIDREGRAQALRHMVDAARAVIAQKRSILIFPEGHRMAPGAKPDYKPGVAALYAQLDVSCVPVALNSGLFWTGPFGFLKKRGRIIVQFLEPIPSGLRSRVFLERLELRIETATAALLTEGHALLDRKQAQHAAAGASR